MNNLSYETAKKTGDPHYFYWIPFVIAILSVVGTLVHPFVGLLGTLSLVYLWTTFLLALHNK